VFGLAMEIPSEGLVTAGFVLCGLGAGAVKFFFEHRELKKKDRSTVAVHKLLEEREKTIGALRAHIGELEKQVEESRRAQSYREVLDAKDQKLEDLSKALSKKSDEFAVKIQELLTLTLEKAEEAGDKNATLVERMVEKVAAFTDEVRKLSAAMSALSHRPPRAGG
jgi:molybdopterin converting factor small subunit